MKQFEILEHTADIGIRVYGENLAELFANSALGVQSIAFSIEQVAPRIGYSMEAEGEDLESLLVNWLNEVVFHLDARHVLIANFDIDNINEASIRATAWGEPNDLARNPSRLVVKAATYHQLRIAKENGRSVADVYFDI